MQKSLALPESLKGLWKFNPTTTFKSLHEQDTVWDQLVFPSFYQNMFESLLEILLANIHMNIDSTNSKAPKKQLFVGFSLLKWEKTIKRGNWIIPKENFSSIKCQFCLRNSNLTFNSNGFYFRFWCNIGTPKKLNQIQYKVYVSSLFYFLRLDNTRQNF